MAIDKRRKRGRPPKYDSKYNHHSCRFNEDEEAMLEYICSMKDISKTKAMTEGVKLLYELVRGGADLW